MTPLESLIFVWFIFLQFGAGFSVLYYTSSGQKAELPCDSSPVSCNPYTVKWFYIRQSTTETLAANGHVAQTSSRVAKLTLSVDCFLGIKNITAEDAGRYACCPVESSCTYVYVSVLTVSPISPDADLEKDGTITLRCSLESRGYPCPQNTLQWVNETGSVLTGKGDWYQVYGQTNCTSDLKVKRQTGHNRKYTCKFSIKNTKIKIYAHYTPVFTTKRRDDHQEAFNSAHPTATTIIIISVVVGVTVLLVIVAVLIKKRFWKTVTEIVKETKGVQPLRNSTGDPESDLAYATLCLQNTTATKKVVRDEAVTYSAIKTSQSEDEPVYSNVY